VRPTGLGVPTDMRYALGAGLLARW